MATTDRNTPVDVVGLTSGVASISGLYAHFCVVMSATGGAKCWGENVSGQLGNNTTTNARTPVDVSSHTSGVKQISAGYLSTCLVTTGGAAKCWGEGAYKQLGGGNNTTDRLVPTAVSGLTTGVDSVSGGSDYNCALMTAGGVKCWGYTGGLANGGAGDSGTPVDITGLTSGVKQISTGPGMACAVMSADGSVKCWGTGMLGNGAGVTTNSAVVTVAGLTGVDEVNVGRSVCVKLAAGSAKCWGPNLSGQVGNGATTNQYTPVDVKS